jgi:peptidoglycan/LPS O-acetylase OafA/YrhL
LWSISVEEQFYLVAPWAVKYFNRKALYGFCGVLILAANSWLYYLGKVLASDHRVWADSFVQFECFAAGILLCLVLRGRVPTIAVWERSALVAFSLSCWFFAAYGFHVPFFGEGGHNPGPWPLIGGYALATLGSVLVLVAFLGVNPKLLPGWAIYLGRISFGLYVYHGFALYLRGHIPLVGHLHIVESAPNHPLRAFLCAGLAVALSFALTVLMAALSYRYLETPFLKMKKRHSVIESQPIAGA